MNVGSGSHPAIRFKNIPVNYGPMLEWEQKRSGILEDVVSQTKEGLPDSSLEALLGEALFGEKVRLKKEHNHIFTRRRIQADKRLWSWVQSELVKPPAGVDRKQILDRLLRCYAEEIGGHFNPRVYHFATRAVPWCFSWLLNAASVQRFLPWGMTESLASRLHILGEIPLLQKLANRGTILLVPTHQSNIDSVLLGYVIYLMSLPPFAYGAGLNLFSNPLLSFFMSRLGAYTVDRAKRNEIYKMALKNYSTRILREGVHSIFFPGGGRSRSGAIESKVKLGLLGTGLEAEIEGHRRGSPKPRIYVVPMVTSYHFVLEAKSLIQNELKESGQHRFMSASDESFSPFKVLEFFWKLFSSACGITIRIGKPLDVFGNYVDEEGNSLGPNGTIIDPVRWLTTKGEVCHDLQRDTEYVRELGVRLVDRFHKENTVLTSHLVAFAFFETLRKKYPDFDLYRLLRLSHPQRSLVQSDFLNAVELYHRQLKILSQNEQLHLSETLRYAHTEDCVRDGVKKLGLLHDTAVLRIQNDVVWTENMKLLYYYRNRLAGYGLSLLSGEAGGISGGSSLSSEPSFGHLKAGQYDSKGFLA